MGSLLDFEELDVTSREAIDNIERLYGELPEEDRREIGNAIITRSIDEWAGYLCSRLMVKLNKLIREEAENAAEDFMDIFKSTAFCKLKPHQTDILAATIANLGCYNNVTIFSHDITTIIREMFEASITEEHLNGSGGDIRNKPAEDVVFNKHERK